MVSIPDMEILKNYVLVLDCGHQRRTFAPCEVGRILPCLAAAHHMEMHAVAIIIHIPSGQEVQSIGWLSPQAALLATYDSLRDDAEALPWWRWRERKKLRSEARAVGRAAR